MDHISHVSKMEDLLLPFFTKRQINVVYSQTLQFHTQNPPNVNKSSFELEEAEQVHLVSKFQLIYCQNAFMLLEC